ncbi:MAG: M23 family metallopeptidase [Melioribacteraceae bacterium]|nr:M23 family metallopeptidase [Melioribacteraceae bacterium]
MLEDYYCYKKPVLSPVSGRVVKVVNNLKDMSIGKIDKANNWGNLIIIKDDRGFYVELSHFAEDSIKVKEGDWVERSSMLGLCGNSGYSPQPHIHIQVQETEDVGAHTIEFSFINYIEDGKFYSNDLPSLEKTVEPLHVDNAYDNLMTFVLDDEMKFEVYKENQKTDELQLKVDMEIDGTFYFDSGKGKLYFEKKDGTFYFYSTEGNDKYLNMMLQSVPRFPLAYRDNLLWNDTIPISSTTNKIKKAVVLFLSSFNHNLFRVDVTSKFVSSKKIESEVVSSTLGLKKKAEIELDEFRGFSSFKMEDIELRKVDNE